MIVERSRADYFESVAEGQDAKISANWVINELLGILNKHGKSISESPVSAENLSALIGLISNNTISGKIAKDVFSEMFASGKDPASIVEEKGLKQVTDTKQIEALIDEVLAENPDNVAAYKGGKEKLFGFFVGQVMKKTQGKANPAVVNEILRNKLGKS